MIKENWIVDLTQDRYEVFEQVDFSFVACLYFVQTLSDGARPDCMAPV